MAHRIYKYNGQEVYLEKDSYRNDGTLAVSMHLPDGELFDVITVNLRNAIQSDSMAFLDINNYPDIGKFIERNKLGAPMYINMRSGFCTYPLYTIFTDKF